MKTFRDRYNQTFETGDVICFMRSSGNSLEVAGILSISDAGNAKIVTEYGTHSTFLLTRGHRVVKSTCPVHIKAVTKAMEKSLGKQMRETQEKIKTDLSFLNI